jgi:hypothetical protein
MEKEKRERRVNQIAILNNNKMILNLYSREDIKYDL